MQNPQTDLTAIRAMLAQLFQPYADQPEGMLEATAIWPDKTAGRAPIARHFTAAQLEEASSWLAERNAEGWGIYTGAGLRGGLAPRRGRASKSHVVQSRWAWADFDAEGAAEAARAQLAAVGLNPTFWVQTGSKPYTRWHAWWQLAEPASGAEVEGFMARLVKALDADPAPKAASGVMRLAGGISWPKPEKQGREAELVALHEGSGQIFSKGEVAACLDVLDPPKPKAKPRASQGRAMAASRADSAKIAEALRWIHPDSGYRNWLAVGMALHDAGEPIDTWDSWSQRSQDYDPREIESKWASFGKTSSGVTIATVFDMARKGGADLGAIARIGLPEATQRRAEGQEGLGLAEAEAKLEAALGGFWARRKEGAGVEAVRATLGLGKTDATLRMVARAIRERRAAGDAGAVVAIAAPMHKLSDQMAADFARIAPDLTAAVLRGPEAADPEKPHETVCKRLDAYREAKARLLDPEQEVCRSCPHRLGCRVLLDKTAKADVYVVAHAALASRPPHERAGPPSWWMQELLEAKERKAAAKGAARAQLAGLAEERAAVGSWQAEAEAQGRKAAAQEAKRKAAALDKQHKAALAALGKARAKALEGLAGEERAEQVADFKAQRLALLAAHREAKEAARAERAEAAQGSRAAAMAQAKAQRASLKEKRQGVLAAAASALEEVARALAEERAELESPREGQHLLFTVIDEDPTGALLFGADAPSEMGLDAWQRAPDGGEAELAEARATLARVAKRNGVGPLRRESFKVQASNGAELPEGLAEGLAAVRVKAQPEAAGDAVALGAQLGLLRAEAGAKLEWARKLGKGDGAKGLDQNKTIRRTAAIWRELAEFLGSGAEVTGRLEVVEHAEKGLAIRHCGLRAVQEGWKAGGLLVLDATARAPVLEAVLGQPVLLHEVQAAQPMLRVIQDSSRSFGKSMLVPSARYRNERADKAAENNLKRLHGWLLAKGREMAPALLGLVTYKAVVEKLEAMGLPDNVVTAHFGALRGLNSLAMVKGLAVVGRPLPEQHALERMARALTGRVISGGYDLSGQTERLVRASGGLWWRSDVVACHADPMAQQLLEAVRDGEVQQAVGRMRAVRRKEEVTCWLFSDAVMPWPVERAELWAELGARENCALARQLEAGGIAFASGAAAARAYPEIWASKQAASYALADSLRAGSSAPAHQPTGQKRLYRDSLITFFDQSRAPTALEYSVPRARQRAVALVDCARHPDPVAALLRVIPEAKEIRVLDAPERAKEAEKQPAPAHNESAKPRHALPESWAIHPPEALAALKSGLQGWQSSPAGKRARAFQGYIDARRVAAAPP